MNFFSNYMNTKAERGASMVEYSLLIALISIVCIGGVRYMGQATTKPFCQVGAALRREAGDQADWYPDQNGDGKPECIVSAGEDFDDLWD